MTGYLETIFDKIEATIDHKSEIESRFLDDFLMSENTDMIVSKIHNPTDCFNIYISTMNFFVGTAYYYGTNDNSRHKALKSNFYKMTELYDYCSKKYDTYTYDLIDYDKECFSLASHRTITTMEIIKCAEKIQTLDVDELKLKETSKS